MQIRKCKVAIAIILLSLLTACAGRNDYKTYYLAEQGDYDGALQAARAAQKGGIDDLPFDLGSGLGLSGGACRDYAAVVTVLVAKTDFAGARDACRDYDQQCAMVPNSDLCFYYRTSELDAAGSDPEVAESLSSEARQNLHFRWLMIRDAFNGQPIRRPIF